jgi:Protein of unknown function (DUF1203)
MSTKFQLVGIDPAPFQALFDLTDEQLNQLSAKRRIADESPGYPCRISLEDAQVGEELLLLPYRHQPAASPYGASGPIFIRRGVEQRTLPPGEVPSYVTNRLMSLRAYDSKDMIIDASVCEGIDAASEIAKQFSNPEVAYIHLHNAKRGCYSCKAVRA